MGTPRLGFIGLGNIGLPMARRIARAGHAPLVYDPLAERVATIVAEGGRAAPSSAAVAAECDVVGLCVRDDADVVAAMTGPDGVLAGAARGVIVAVHSTVRRGTVSALAAQAVARGVHVIDAGVAGGAIGADQGTLTVTVGGPADVVAQAQPLFGCFARRVFHVGPLGAGMAAKLCNQVMQYVAWAAAHEALALAAANGISQDMLEAVTESTGALAEPTRRFLSTSRRPAAERESAAFQEYLRGFAAIAEKDLGAALDLGTHAGVALPATERLLPLMRRIFGVVDATDTAGGASQ